MSDMNVHIGCHGIFDDALNILLSSAESNLKLSDIKAINRRAYRKHWRTAILSGDSSDIDYAKHSELTIDILGDNDHLHVLSIPDLLGQQRYIAKAGKLYDGVEDRINTLLSISEGINVSVRIIICEIDAFAALNGFSSSKINFEIEMPWVELVSRISACIYPTPLQVHAVHNPEKFSQRLAEILFDPFIPIDEDMLDCQTLALNAFEAQAGGYYSPERLARFEDELKRIESLENTDLYVL